MKSGTNGELMARTIIELKNVSFRYGEDQKLNALNNISLDIQEGEWITLIGPNGSGKSTLTKVMNGLIVPDAGDVIIDGITLDKKTLYEARKKIGMVFQNPENQFVGSTVEDDVAFGLENLFMPREEMLIRVKESLERVGMWELANRAPVNLSGGQKQRVAIASIIASKPQIIVLDEATSMLDPQGREEVLATIKEIKEEDNLTIISITHDINEAVESDRIIVMNEGQIVDQGVFEEISTYGDQLLELGLEVPFSESLKQALQEQGFNVPEKYLTDEEMMEFLWTYSSEM